jgi:hypothetical protein
MGREETAAVAVVAAMAGRGGAGRGKGGRCGGTWGNRVCPTDRGGGEVPFIEGIEREI